MMKCHYEVLGVDREVTDSDLKKAYKKLALKWHPDKNPDTIEEAKEIFLLIQQAFEVLSDPRERKWYDVHREDILRGVGKDEADILLDVFQYFTSSCYKGYGDDEKGFYTVYRDVFKRIAEEDKIYMSENLNEIPEFGSSDSNYVEVVQPFYAYWTSYCTKNVFTWLDPFSAKDAPNRRYFRAVEKENKKIRDQAKKKRNEEVRNLVAFVRKRDKRVQEWTKLLAEKAKESAKKSEEKRKQIVKARKDELASYTEAEWSKFSNFEKELELLENNLTKEFGDEVSASDEDVNEESDYEEKIDSYFCLACHKSFKNEKSFANHEKSKKHKDNVEILKQTNINEDGNSYSDDDSNCDQDGDDENEISACNENDIALTLEENGKKLKKKKLKKKKSFIDFHDQHFRSESPESELNEKILGETSDALDFTDNIRKKKKKKKNSEANQSRAAPPLDELEVFSSSLATDKEIPRDVSQGKGTVEALCTNFEHKNKIKSSNKNIEIAFKPNENENETYNQKNKLSQKLHKNKATLPANNEHLNGKSSSTLNCETCGQSFISKNKLFIHLKTTGHAVPIEAELTGKKVKKGRRYLIQ